jgi:hypothetical protein
LSDEGVARGYYRLARAMVNEAVKDYLFSDGKDRLSARRFFRNGGYFDTVCKIAELDPSTLLSGIGFRKI